MPKIKLDIVIINNAESGIFDFVNPIKKILDTQNDVTSKIIAYLDTPNHDVTRYNGVILSASPLGNNIVHNRLPYYNWLLDYEKPVLGICAGHQIIGCFFGGRLLRRKESEMNSVTIKIIAKDAILRDCKNQFTAYQQHFDSVTCPKGFLTLARSKKCKVQILKHINKPIFSTQFHAEISNKRIIQNFIDIARQYSLVRSKV